MITSTVTPQFQIQFAMKWQPDVRSLSIVASKADHRGVFDALSDEDWAPRYNILW